MDSDWYEFLRSPLMVKVSCNAVDSPGKEAIVDDTDALRRAGPDNRTAGLPQRYSECLRARCDYAGRAGFVKKT